MTESVLLYRFLPAESAILSIESDTLRVGRILELNDPFEWMPSVKNASGSEAEKRYNEWILESRLKDLNEKFGVMCMSETSEETLLWSHYADSHKGIVFEFDYLINPALYTVEYKDKRPFLDRAAIHDSSRKEEVLNVLNKSMYRKSTSWSYERERRVFIDLARCDVKAGMYFTRIPSDFLKRVILGIRCGFSTEYVSRALDLCGHEGVEVVRARRDEESYNILC